MLAKYQFEIAEQGVTLFCGSTVALLKLWSLLLPVPLGPGQGRGVSHFPLYPTLFRRLTHVYNSLSALSDNIHNKNNNIKSE